MSVDYPLAQEHFVPRNFMFNSNACKAIVIHKTGGDATPQSVYNTFLASGNPGNSVHYAIGTDGTIWQFVPESLGAGGNGRTEVGYDPFWAPYVNEYDNLNLCTLSIEHCDGSLSNSTAVTPAQKDASFKLVAYLAKKYNIPATHIKTHASIDPVDRARCPGNYPMDELIAYVQGGNTSMSIPTGWKDNGTTLVASNGISVVKGFRDLVLHATSWDAGNVPLETEHAANPVLLHNAAVGAGSRQCFRDCLLCYTTAKGVWQEPYLGWETDAAYKQIATLQAAQPVPVDTAQVEADVNVIIDATPPLFAKLLADIKKL